MIIESSSKYNYQIQKHDSNKLSIFLYLSELSNLDLVLNRFGEAPGSPTPIPACRDCRSRPWLAIPVRFHLPPALHYSSLSQIAYGLEIFHT
jgi:hypothetical protein